MSQVETKDFLKRGSDSSETTKTIAVTVTPESGLVLEDCSMTPTLAETKQQVGNQIMVRNTSKPWDISLCSNHENSRVLIGFRGTLCFERVG